MSSTAIVATTNTTKIMRQIGLFFIANLLLIASAKISLPWLPVPVTLQTLATLFIGLQMGARMGFLVVSAYLFEGALGLPVFASTMTDGLTLGFLIGFPQAAIIAGWCSDKGYADSLVGMLTVSIVALVPIFLFGFAWLALFVGVATAWKGGVAPFLLVELLKLAFLCVVVTGVKHLKK